MITDYRRVPFGNPKCSQCLHYAPERSACEIGQLPDVCGDGSRPDLGFAPLHSDSLMVVGIPQRPRMLEPAAPIAAAAVPSLGIDPPQVVDIAAGPSASLAMLSTEQQSVSATDSDEAVNASIDEVFEQIGPTDLNVVVGVVTHVGFDGVARPGNGSNLLRSIANDESLIVNVAAQLLPRAQHMHKSMCRECSVVRMNQGFHDGRLDVAQFGKLVKAQLSYRLMKGYNLSMLDSVLMRRLPGYENLIKGAGSHAKRTASGSVSAAYRKKNATLSEGRFPIGDKDTADKALKLRGHAKTAQERKKIVQRAARYVPDKAKAAAKADGWLLNAVGPRPPAGE